jgi:hypothetical protein
MFLPVWTFLHTTVYEDMMLSGELDDGGTGGIFGGVFTFQVCDGHFIQRITAY